MSYEAWGEPDEQEEPLDRVEFPRERKPWKRDRQAIGMLMQCAIVERKHANPLFVDDSGRAHGSRDHAFRFQELNLLHYEIFRFRMGVGYGPRRSHRFDALARLHRIADGICIFDKAPLP